LTQYDWLSLIRSPLDAAKIKSGAGTPVGSLGSVSNVVLFLLSNFSIVAFKFYISIFEQLSIIRTVYRYFRQLPNYWLEKMEW
jgi:hypothetical protein